jgi:hypothetical protein
MSKGSRTSKYQELANCKQIAKEPMEKETVLRRESVVSTL